MLRLALVCYTLKDLKDAKEVAMAVETAIASKQVIPINVTYSERFTSACELSKLSCFKFSFSTVTRIFCQNLLLMLVVRITVYHQCMML